MKNSDKSAYPQDLPNTKVSPNEAYDMIDNAKGLTKREYFAAKAMQGLLSNNAIIDGTEKEWIAKESIRQAEETLKQLEETQ